ncbi:MAG: hypothetical protein J5I93_15210 [Pirellulaceae bacterium]|nr:hypothetical protein [Pirellulaceae bacterium]
MRVATWLRASLAPLLLWATTNHAPAQEPVAAARPKYGASAVRLHRDQAYLRQAPAPDYWALSPYYAGQLDDLSCSVATAAMVVNAALAERDLAADHQLARPAGLLRRVHSPEWTRAVGPGGAGVTLDQMSGYLRLACAAYGATVQRIDVLHVDDASAETQDRIHRLLVQNERSANDLVVVNFLQSVLTGDPAGAVGHLAPLAAYDAGRRRALVLDPDRQWYEPYWVPLDRLVTAMATQDETSRRPRGLMHVTFR